MDTAWSKRFLQGSSDLLDSQSWSSLWCWGCSSSPLGSCSTRPSRSWGCTCPQDSLEGTTFHSDNNGPQDKVHLVWNRLGKLNSASYGCKTGITPRKKVMAVDNDMLSAFCARASKQHWQETRQVWKFCFYRSPTYPTNDNWTLLNFIIL